MADTSDKNIQLDMTVGFNPTRFPAINNQLCYNLFDFEGAMVPTAGFTELFKIGDDNEARGMFYSDILRAVVAVIDDGIFKITDSSKTRIGSLTTLSERVYIAENSLTTDPNSSTGDPGGQIAISDGQNIVIFTLDGNITIATNDSGEALDFVPGVISFQDDRFFANDLSSNRIYASAINNATEWPSDSFSTIASITTACTTFERMLLVFGKDITAVFYDSASTPFPYSQDVSREWEYGCLSPETLSNASGMLAWLASDRYSKPVVLSSDGGEPTKISNAGIDAIMDGFSDPTDSEGYMYLLQGHLFYQINFLTDKQSFVYDFVTKKWFGVTDVEEGSLHPIRQTAYYEEGNNMLAITNEDGNIYEVNLNIFTNNGKIIPRTIVTQNYTQEERPFKVQELDIQIEQGENQNTSKVCLAVSKDRGRTYRIQQVKELGNIGFRQELLRFRQLGNARWWTFKINFFSEDRFAILSATAFIQ